jgi:DNA-directed RNA polymerase specialized sigma24 family protein
VGARLVQLLVLRAGYDKCDAEDIAIEIFLRLLEDNSARLRSFRGSSDPELHAWLAKVAHNFAFDYLDRSIRARRRERQARKQLTLPDRSGPTEDVVAASVADLATIAKARDIDRMRVISGLSRGSGAVTTLIATVTTDVSTRTHRRWMADLYEKFGKLL